ncbi:hypothetical protein L1887_49662 [Cichorium endivia]|nr:hypothetical protein L1887_49662 [Cichorium endivia]
MRQGGGWRGDVGSWRGGRCDARHYSAVWMSGFGKWTFAAAPNAGWLRRCRRLAGWPTRARSPPSWLCALALSPLQNGCGPSSRERSNHSLGAALNFSRETNSDRRREELREGKSGFWLQAGQLGWHWTAPSSLLPLHPTSPRRIYTTDTAAGGTQNIDNVRSTKFQAADGAVQVAQARRQPFDNIGIAHRVQQPMLLVLTHSSCRLQSSGGCQDTAAIRNLSVLVGGPDPGSTRVHLDEAGRHATPTGQERSVRCDAARALGTACALRPGQPPDQAVRPPVARAHPAGLGAHRRVVDVPAQDQLLVVLGRAHRRAPARRIDLVRAAKPGAEAGCRDALQPLLAAAQGRACHPEGRGGQERQVRQAAQDEARQALLPPQRR